MANWRKILGWTAAALGALLLVTLAAPILLVKSPAFHRYLVAKIEQQAGQAVGSRVEIRNLQIHLRNLSADVYGFVVHGREGAAEKPLLEVEHLRVELRILSILGREVRLQDLLIDRPVIHLSVDQQGRSNLPEPPPSTGSSNTNLFQLEVGRVLVTGGEIDARDRRIPVAANLEGLRTEITFRQPETYAGTISYQNGLIQYPGLRPFPHALGAKFSATPSELEVESLVLSTGASRLELEGKVRDYTAAPVANAHYEIRVHPEDFRELLKGEQASGEVILRGGISYREVPGQAAAKNVALSGNILSNGLRLVTPDAAARIDRIEGKYQLANGDFRADAFTVDLFGGRLTAEGTIRQIDSAQKSHFHGELSGISLPAVKSAFGRLWGGQPAPVQGRLSATGDASWQGALEKLKASSNVTMRGAVGDGSTRQREVPLTADVHADYDGARQLLSVGSSSIQLPAASIRAQGQIGNHSNLTIHASTNHLGQFVSMLEAIPLAAGAKSESLTPQRLPEIAGEATLDAMVTGTLEAPRIAARVSSMGLKVNRSEWKSVELALAASPSQVSIEKASLVSAQRGQLTLTAELGLRNWSYLETDPLAANVEIRQLRIAELQQIANLDYPVEGVVFGSLQLRGSEVNPLGQGRIQIRQPRIAEEPLTTVSAQFHAANGTVHSNLLVGVMSADVSYTPKTHAYELKLASSPIDLSRSHTVQARNLPLKGLLSLTANGSGTITDPQLTASIEINQLQLEATSFSRAEAALDVRNHLAKLALSSGASGAALRGNATVHLSSPYSLEASLDTSKFAFDPFLALYMPSLPSGLRGETEMHASIRGPLADMRKLEAHITIPVLDARYQSIEVAASRPIRASYANSLVTVEPASFQGTDTSLEFQGKIPVNRPGALEASVRGSIGVGLAQMFSPDLRAGGDIRLNLNATGTFANPAVNGQIRLEKISLSSEELPLGLQDLNALMEVTDTGVQITSGSGQLGSGQISLGGSVLYRPELRMNVLASAKGVRLRYPEGVRTVFDSELTLSGDRQASLLQGRVLIDSVSFSSYFDLSSLVSQFRGAAGPPSTGGRVANQLKLQIAVQSTSQLSAGTSQLGIEGNANLRVIGTAADPVITGRADLTSGEIFFDKNRYQLERGMITFANPNQTEPVLNLLITTTINQYNLSITVRGPIDKLETTYVSDPALSPIDIINLIARGQTTTESASTSFGANELLATGLGEVSSEVTKLTGISGLQIDPLIGGENANPSARIGIQKRVTKNFLFTFSTDVTQPESEIIQGEYQFSRRWSVSVVRNQIGGVAVDGRYHTSF